MPNKLSHALDLFFSIARLPVARLEFRLAFNPDDVQKIYSYFTQRHPKYKIFQNKSLGAALVDLARFSDRQAYMESIKGNNSAEKHARKARSKGYRVVEIDKNNFVDEIHEINTSVESRQGRSMDSIYTQKTLHFSSEKNFKYYGVLNSSGKLMGYVDLGFYGNFAAFNRIIGVRNNDGVMHFLATEIICQMIEQGSFDYVMYDTYFGAGPGLKTFKKMLGFEPHRAKYSIQ
ncbi:MAG: hypothetical protein H7335_12800 [Massilia sp.]|nr:hypothetical protein [Massilia sp.]